MNPLRQVADRLLFLTGWSQSAGYVMRYLHSFASLNQSLFAGYLSAGGGAKPAPINAYTPAEINFLQSPGAGTAGASQPLIVINTESENTLANWAGDSNSPGNLLRVYEIAGASHDSKYNLLDYYQGDEDTKRIDMLPQYQSVEKLPNDYPAEPIYNATWCNLFLWARTGMPAPHAPRIKQKNREENEKDAFGNTIGGLRTAALDLPTAAYESYSMMADGRRNWLFGHVPPFTGEMIKSLYGSRVEYEKRVAANTEYYINQGFVLKEDAGELNRHIVEAAIDRGL